MMKSLTRVNLSFVWTADISSRGCDFYLMRGGSATRGQRVVYIMAEA